MAIGTTTVMPSLSRTDPKSMPLDSPRKSSSSAGDRKTPITLAMTEMVTDAASLPPPSLVRIEQDEIVVGRQASTTKPRTMSGETPSLVEMSIARP